MLKHSLFFVLILQALFVIASQPLSQAEVVHEFIKYCVNECVKNNKFVTFDGTNGHFCKLQRQSTEIVAFSPSATPKDFCNCNERIQSFLQQFKDLDCVDSPISFMVATFCFRVNRNSDGALVCCFKTKGTEKFCDLENVLRRLYCPDPANLKKGLE